jgi:digeranylgeranylglycerophospholipid reductase
VESADVVVLGLGPAGASAAAEAARRGCRVIALDRKKEAGIPVQCAELLPGLLEVDAAAVRQRIDAMLTFVEDDAPDRKPDFPGRMLDRAAFDASLVREAIQAGAECRFGVLLKALPKVSAKVIIGADGPRSVAGRAIGSVNRELVETRQITVPLLASHSATDIFLSANIPGGYGWLFPKGDVANLGAGVVPERKGALKAIVERLHERLKREGRVGSRVLATTGGAIPVGGMLKPTGHLNETLVLLAGDAAGLANPVTGAGIAAAVHSGRMAGEAAAEYLSKGTQRYEEDLEDLFQAALERARRRRRELMESSMDKTHLRRGWIAYPEYWQ